MNSTSGEPLVELRHLNKAFGGLRAVNDVSLVLHPGEVVGLLGHNGAGKSTLVAMLAGALRPDSGTVVIGGKEFSALDPKSAKELGVEMIYQNLALAGNLDAVANLFLGREIRRLRFFRNKRAMRRDAEVVLKRINPRFKNINDDVRNLSGGQRQSIAIARAIYFHANVLILDEPTAALGPTESRLVKDQILQLKNEGVAILLISHDLHDVFELADKLVVMADGRVVGRLNAHEASKDEVLSMIILGDQDGRDAVSAVKATLEATNPLIHTRDQGQ